MHHDRLPFRKRTWAIAPIRGAAATLKPQQLSGLTRHASSSGSRFSLPLWAGGRILQPASTHVFFRRPIMKKSGLLATFAVMVLAVVGRAEEDSKKALEKLRGTWAIQSVTLEGTENNDAGGISLVIDGDQWSVKTDDDDKQGTLKIGMDKKLHTIDMSIAKGDDSGKKCLGIYELSDDTLKLCVSLPGESERPTEFKAEAGSKRVLLVLKKK
jgi:uncharacterized protein (TIGR03067 family)